MSQVWRLQSGKVVVNHGGNVEILTPPVGVSYDIKQKRWRVWTLDKDNNWMAEYASVAHHGSVRKALEAAAAMRDRALSFLLTVRLLPRIRRGYTPIEVGGLYAVYDPNVKRRRYFTSEAAADAFNNQAVKEWVIGNLYDPASMVERRKLMSLSFTGEGVPCI